MLRIISKPKWTEISKIRKFRFWQIGCHDDEYEHFPKKDQVMYAIILTVVFFIPTFIVMFFLITRHYKNTAEIGFYFDIFMMCTAGIVDFLLSRWLKKFFIIKNAWEKHIGNSPTYMIER